MAWKKIIPAFCLITGLSVVSPAQQTVIKQVMDAPPGFCISEEEYQLYQMINEYRHQYDLPPIALSKSLSFVAATHARDLYLYHSEESPCNFHSWSDKGPWKPFCYPADENKKNSVWDKPREISKYNNRGYEIVYWENSPVVVDSVFDLWRSIEYFNSFLMNTGKWELKRWNAIGIAIFKNYAVAWFGETPDPAGNAWICGKEPIPPPPPPGQKPAIKDSTASAKQQPAVKPAPKPQPQPPADPVQITDPQKGKFYIIVKSQLPAAEATKLVESLKQKGYPDAKVFEKDGKSRVSVAEADNRADATKILSEVKKLYKDAWLLIL